MPQKMINSFPPRFSIAKLAVLVVLFLSSVVICRPIVDFPSSADLDENNAIGLNAIDRGPFYPATAASVVSPYRMEFAHQGINSSLSIGQMSRMS